MLTGYKCKTTVMITQLHRCHTAVPSDLIISNNQLSRNQSNQPISLSLDGTWQQTMAEGLNKGKESTSVVDLTIDVSAFCLDFDIGITYFDERSVFILDNNCSIGQYSYAVVHVLCRSIHSLCSE